MFYPLKFKPVYKDYIWGGRGFEKLGKVLPEGIVAESWEVSCHPDGVSIIANGRFEGLTLFDLVKRFPLEVIGNSVATKDLEKFPLLVKFIDANDNLSVQVHPDDAYAFTNENGEYGKNEMWYIVDAEPGAQLICDVLPGVTRETFAQAIKEKRTNSCLKYIEVEPGDVIDIPAGLLHAIGKGILLAEVQQNSNTTYRVYDFDRVDKEGKSRPLHVDKALQVIDFNSEGRRDKFKGQLEKISDNLNVIHMVANDYFVVERHDIDGSATYKTKGERFYIYTIVEGVGQIKTASGNYPVKKGESVLIPAVMTEYTIEGKLQAIRCCVP